MKESKMKFALILLSLATLFSIAGCNKQQPTTQPAPLRFALDWHPEPEFGGFYAAELNHSFQAQGLNVELKPVGDGAAITVADGKCDFGTTGADQVLIARGQGADVVALFAVYQICPQGVMVHKARGFKSLADVFTHPGVLEADDASWVKYCTDKFGKKDLQITGNGIGIGTFLSRPDDSKQCYITSEPILAANQHSDPQAFLIADAGFNPYTTVVITSGDMVRKNPGKVRAMIAACTAGWTAYLNDPVPANAFMQTLNKDMDAATFTAAAEAQKPLIRTEQTDAGGLGMMTVGRWDQLSRQLLELKAIDKPIPATDCFVTPDQLK
jgi:NitT/TauT family transport system substrate-binding protein